MSNLLLPAPPRPKRLAVAFALACLLVSSVARPVWAFGLDDVAKRAKRIAAMDYKDPRGGVPQWLLEISYDQWRDIRFRKERALWKDLPFSIEFFHLGLFYDRAVRIYVVTPKGVTPLKFSPEQYDYGKNEFGSRVPQDLGYAGFRIHYPIKTATYQDEVAVFLGASYLRALGRDQVFGVSGRGLAIDTALPSGEEFPWFREFWLVRPGAAAQELTLFALLDSPSATGAYKIVVAPGEQTRVDVELRLFPRTAIQKLGIAPFTSMFLHGENTSPHEAPDDYRPEAHDSDGLLVNSQSGEWLWRPLQNPSGLNVTSFAQTNPRGFGLLQRDRNFDHYQDLEARPDLRPSTWVQPKGDWGAGRVEVVEIPTRADSNDNVVIYWVPDAVVAPKAPVSLAYSIYWYDNDRTRPPGGWTAATRSDSGTIEGARRLVVDFEGSQLKTLPEDAVVQGVVTTTATDGPTPGQPRPAELLEQQVIRNPLTGGWRLVFQVRPPDDDPVELRAFLRHGENVITETWSYLLLP